MGKCAAGSGLSAAAYYFDKDQSDASTVERTQGLTFDAVTHIATLLDHGNHQHVAIYDCKINLDTETK